MIDVWLYIWIVHSRESVCCVVKGMLVFFLMIRRPPRSTRTDTLFPYTTLFRSVFDTTDSRSNQDVSDYLTSNIQDPLSRVDGVGDVHVFGAPHPMRIRLNPPPLAAMALLPGDVVRPEGRAGGQECVRTGRSRLSPYV